MRIDQVIDTPTSKTSALYRDEINNIAKALRAICAKIDLLVEKSKVEKVEEEQMGPLSPDQLRKRNERDTKRREKITQINADAVAKTTGIRKDMGK